MNWESGIRRGWGTMVCGVKKAEVGPDVVLLIAELCRGYRCGLRPLRAVGSIYEPEAVGAIRPVSLWPICLRAGLPTGL